MLDATFKGAKVLITGNTGFKGSWLTCWLKKLGANVAGISSGIFTDPSMYKLLGGSNFQNTQWIDVVDVDELTTSLKTHNPKFIFHLAAQSIVGEAYENPFETWRTNTLGTVSLLEAVRRSGLENVVVVMVTSDKVYDNSEWYWPYREIDRLGGADPYSASKAAAELAIQSFYRSGLFQKSIRISSVRAGNVIGGGDWAKGRLVPDAIRAWGSNEKLLIRNPNATRPWQHVLEPISGYLLTAAKLAVDVNMNGESFNFGPSDDESKSVLELLELISSELSPEKGLRYRLRDDEDFAESGLLALSSHKARAALNWHSILTVQESATLTAEWYRKVSEGSDPNEITISQIERYESKAKERQSWARQV